MGGLNWRRGLLTTFVVSAAASVLALRMEEGDAGYVFFCLLAPLSATVAATVVARRPGASIGVGGVVVAAAFFVAASVATSLWLDAGHAWLEAESECTDRRAVAALTTGAVADRTCMWFGTERFYRDGRSSGRRCLAWMDDHRDSAIRCVDAAGVVQPLRVWDND